MILLLVLKKSLKCALGACGCHLIQLHRSNAENLLQSMNVFDTFSQVPPFTPQRPRKQIEFKHLDRVSVCIYRDILWRVLTWIHCDIFGHFRD